MHLLDRVRAAADGDIQQHFIDSKVRNFYSVSISGYHIAEAGANPVSQLAFTLANGFTFVEYYLSRGMHIDDFAPNLSFFFSNGMDPEYTVLGRVARRIWAKTIRDKYQGTTAPRSSNTISRPRPLSPRPGDRVQRYPHHAPGAPGAARQLQLAPHQRLRRGDHHAHGGERAARSPFSSSSTRSSGLARNENPTQGSFIVEELTDLVEAAVLGEFRSISERGGVLGAMERMYQRSKIQDESLHYETLKHDGTLPIIGVNTFLDPKGSPTVEPPEVIRASTEEKGYAIDARNAFWRRNAAVAPAALEALKRTALDGGNVFAALMEACKVCTLGQLSRALYQVGGQYRRNM